MSEIIPRVQLMHCSGSGTDKLCADIASDVLNNLVGK